MDNKQKLSEIKICVKEIGAFLEEENQNIITLLDDNQRLAEVSWNDFGTHINFWIASVCNSKCYEDLSAFVREEEIVNSLNYFLTIKNLLNDIKANNYNKDIALSRLKSGITIQNANSQNRDFKQFFENLQARLVHFMPFIKEERLANEIKNISEFTTKKK